MRKILLLTYLFPVLLVACKKNDQLPVLGPTLERFPVTGEEKEVVALHKEVGDILLEVYQDEAAWQEVNAAIYTAWYVDERVLLEDLLFPEESALYHSAAFIKSGRPAGIFKERFMETMNKGDFPVLRRQMNEHTAARHQLLTDPAGSSSPPPSTARFNNISIYFPYASTFQQTAATRSGSGRNSIAIVAADREADEAPGYELYPCGLKPCIRKVLVNDDYCDSIPTHIITQGAETPVKQDTPATAPVHVVMLGNVLCRQQYDKLISFTGNGGGSELRFVRGDGFLEQNNNGQISSPQNTVSVNISRSDIRKKRWVTVNSIWDANWEVDNKEQVFGIYEEDNEGSQTLAGSIETKLWNFTIELIDYSFTVQTKDDIIRQLSWNRESFFLFNQGNLNNGCGQKDGWTVYDCLSPVAYTLPLHSPQQ